MPRPGLLSSIVLSLGMVLICPHTVFGHPGGEIRIELLTAKIAAHPESQVNYIHRAQAYSNEGALHLALDDLQHAETLGDPVLVAFDLGVVHYRRGELDKAKADLDRFLERFPHHAQALNYRARVLRDAGDHQGSIADFKAYFALQKNPNPGDYVSAAKQLEDMNDGGPKAALDLLDQGMEALGLIPQLQNRAIEIERKQGNISQALTRQETLKSVLGESPDWKFTMGELLQLANRPKEACQWLNAASTQAKSLRQTTARRNLIQRIENQMTHCFKPL